MAQSKPKTNTPDFRFTLKELLVTLGVSRYYAAKTCGISYGCLTDMVYNQTKGVELETLQKLCRGLGVKIADIISES